MGGWLDFMIFEVFSSLNDSMILCHLRVLCSALSYTCMAKISLHSIFFFCSLQSFFWLFQWCARQAETAANKVGIPSEA